ncbi:MAG TPA: zinc-ribbon domain-containing protein, partial [Clostridiales bacterium]|nr:zinc-ribbon domain-containing protein [Clostridiales bacterium]
MFCENCGKEIRDGSVFCTYCGAQTTSYQQSDYYTSSNVSPGAKGAAISAMVWGIVALVTCQLPLGFIVGIVGMNKYRLAEEL